MKRAFQKLLRVGYPVYHAIAQLNRSFEACVETLDHAMTFNLVPPERLRAYQVMIEETRALANQDFAEVINDREFQNSAYYEHLRIKWQSQCGEEGKTKEATPRRLRAGRQVRP
jgi:hypothetical protein